MKCISQYYLLAIVLFFICTACATDQKLAKQRKWMTANDKIKVLSTIGMINDLIEKVGGEHIDSITLISEQLDPHSYQLVKGDDEKLSFADIIFYNGLGLEHGPSLQYYLQKNPKAVGLGDKVYAENSDLFWFHEGVLDPHMWMDISLWSRIVFYIVQTLQEKDPEHAAEYAENGRQLQKELLEAHEEVRRSLQEIPENKRFLVTSHDAFNYFTRAYLANEKELEDGSWTKRFAAPEGLAPESQISSVDIQKIIDHLKKYEINVLFPESNVSKDSIRKIVQAGKEIGLDVHVAACNLYGDAMGQPGTEGDNYIGMIKHNARIIKHFFLQPIDAPIDCEHSEAAHA